MKNPPKSSNRLGSSSVDPHYSDPEISTLIQLAIQEDGYDRTSEALFPENPIAKAEIRAKALGVLCGSTMVEGVLSWVDPHLTCNFHLQDAATLQSGTLIATLTGQLQSLLRAERPALNFLQQLSGVATETHQFVEAVAGTKVKILDTRKTIPGWRRLQKYAVRVGGGYNHRLRLDEMLLVKDNHLVGCGGIAGALQRLKVAAVDLPIEIEVANLDELQLLLKLQSQQSIQLERIMLDNFTPKMVRQAVDLCSKVGKISLEVSGGVNLENIRAYAESGIDFISVGRLTHSAPALDLSMEIVS